MKQDRILITAGATREYIDPVRYITNNSSGLLGYLLAESAIKRGYKVTLISTPTCLNVPDNIYNFISVKTTAEMEKAVLAEFVNTDALFMTSAVCDYRPAIISHEKIKEKNNDFYLKLIPNNDILQEVAKIKDKQFICGFCIETNDLEQNAYNKLKNKQMDLIVASLLNDKLNPFGNNKMNPLIIDKSGKKYKLENISKEYLADYLISKIGDIKPPAEAMNDERIKKW